MGGKALKNTTTRRYTKTEYESILPEIVSKLTDTLYIEPVKAYRDKKSFGDADIVVVFSVNINPVEYIKQQFQPNEIVKNSSVISFDYKQLQVDIITVSDITTAVFASNYFAYNDLGNFIGRTAHRLGFKFGQTGLHYVLRDSENETVQIAEITVTNCFESALQFLDYDPLIHSTGFDTLHQIFEYTTSSRYFEPAQYALSNRTSEARRRDRIRPSYIAILEYMESMFSLTDTAEKVPVDRQFHLERAFKQFPTFKLQYDSNLSKHTISTKYKQNFNGKLISEWYGLTGVELGKFVHCWTKYFEEHDMIEHISTLSNAEFKYMLNNLIKDTQYAN